MEICWLASPLRNLGGAGILPAISAAGQTSFDLRMNTHARESSGRKHEANGWKTDAFYGNPLNGFTAP